MSPIIIDASAALALYLKDEGGDYATSLLRSLGSYRIIIPSHWWVEVSSGLLIAERRKRINFEEIDELMQRLIELDPEIIQITQAEYAQKIIPLARSYKLTSYDACYLYLALKEKAPLATLDKALKMAAGNAGAKVYK